MSKHGKRGRQPIKISLLPPKEMDIVFGIIEDEQRRIFGRAKQAYRWAHPGLYAQATTGEAHVSGGGVSDPTGNIAANNRRDQMIHALDRLANDITTKMLRVVEDMDAAGGTWRGTIEGKDEPTRRRVGRLITPNELVEAKMMQAKRSEGGMPNA